MKSNVYSILLIVLVFVQLKCTEPPGMGIVRTYTYSSSMMDETLVKGKTYQLDKNNQYHHNEIVVYDYEDVFEGKKVRTASRVVGLPGDTIRIIAGNIYVNRRKFALPATATYHYAISLKYVDDQIIRDLNIQGEDFGYYNCYLTESKSKTMSEKYANEILSLRKGPLEMNNNVLLNLNNSFGWDMDNFGPVVIPRRGSVIHIDTAKIFLNKVERTNSHSDSVEINKEYYFVIGDNFHNSTTDSRRIGLISADQILGAIKK